MTRGSRIAAAAIVVALAVAGCSPEPDRPNAYDLAPTTTTTSPAAADEAVTTAAGADATWTELTAPSSCMCSDGSPFRYWIKRANPKKVVFFLQGGGACFNAQTCGPTGATFTRNLDKEKGPTPTGIFDADDERNPFRDYSFVYVPYCTGDVHLGNATHDYGGGVVIHHNGYVNASTALAATAAAFPEAEQVAVVGASAGSAGAPLYAGLASDVLPDADIRVLADSSGAYPGTPAVTKAIGALWGTTNAIPPWPENEGIIGEQWTLPGLFVQSGKHDPDIVFGRHDFAYDSTQARFAALAGIPADDLVSLIDSNEQLVEDGGVDLHTYVAPGTDHTVVQKPAFYTEEVGGTKLVDWVTQLLGDDPPGDVRCTECGPKVPPSTSSTTTTTAAGG
jgi:hypothetical protein